MTDAVTGPTLIQLSLIPPIHARLLFSSLAQEHRFGGSSSYHSVRLGKTFQVGRVSCSCGTTAAAAATAAAGVVHRNHLNLNFTHGCKNEHNGDQEMMPGDRGCTCGHARV